ncbi:hypothetical protein halTADL_2227 [Halohasta litchfieldiae]|jgi:hypothetical protein|uniref:Uncharacterized protein n=1 Tax=Halohasta litchfieldiae TaxID=1073996 RepID=A0A1H6VFA6_9EURY|nr:hypothetical protein [Halohasta litchfieldiae]ATW88974.1 hypothetical protein halTADL_2227 [Halohasta litchfieldiae]SEJ01654.1 hypothetical protein SAMN05444271_11646 [Halohasta litchfieldiae]
MTDSKPYSDRYTVSTHHFGDESRVDEQGYLHTGRAQRQPERVVVSCGTTEGRR